MLHITISRRSAFVIVLTLLLLVPVGALAGSVFEDVEDTGAHIGGITFVQESGVSLGCDTSNNFCPDEPVTRDQMATFLYRLSGNDPDTPASVHAAAADTAAHAETAAIAESAAAADVALDSELLAGEGPLAYTTRVDGVACADGGGCGAVPDSTETVVLELPVAVPAPGVLAASYTISGQADLAANLHTWLSVNQTDVCNFVFQPEDPVPGSWQVSGFAGGVELQGQSGQAVFEAGAGEETIYLCAVMSGDDLSVLDAQVTVLWTATGSGSALAGGPALEPAVARDLLGG